MAGFSECTFERGHQFCFGNPPAVGTEQREMRMWCRLFSQRTFNAVRPIRRGVSTNAQRVVSREIAADSAPPNKQMRRCDWKEMLFPFSCTTQDKGLVGLILEAVDTQKLVVAFNFRGSRMTTTARRIAFRSRYPFLHAWSCWRLLRYRVVHIRDLEGLAKISADMDLVGCGRGFSGRNVGDALADQTGQYLLVGVVLLLVAAMNWLFVDGERAKGKATLLEQVHTALQLTAGEVFLLVVSLFLLKRRLVYIVDDVLCFSLRRGNKCEVRRIIDDLKRASRTRTIVLLSSNEGLPELFSDTNNSTFVTESFEHATADELVRALNRCNPGRPISSTAFQGICESFGMEHHVYSMRWYPLIPNHEFARMVSPEKAAGPALSRSTLRAIALNLDLECPDVAGAYALAYSQVVDVRASLKGYFTEDEINAVVKKYGASGPRRLVLTAALLVTGHDTARCGLVAATVLEAESKLAEAEDAAPPDSKLIEKSKEYLQAVLDTKKKDPQAPASDEDLEEYEFVQDVRDKLPTMKGEEIFGVDSECIVEVRRITWLLIGAPLSRADEWNFTHPASSDLISPSSSSHSF